jgi:hypothetical protein
VFRNIALVISWYFLVILFDCGTMLFSVADDNYPESGGSERLKVPNAHYVPGSVLFSGRCSEQLEWAATNTQTGWKWRTDWLHHYFYSWEVLTCWMHQAVCLNYWHSPQTPMHTPQDMPQEVSSQSPSPEQTIGGTQYYIEPWLHGTLFHIK